MSPAFRMWMLVVALAASVVGAQILATSKTDRDLEAFLDRGCPQPPCVWINPEVDPCAQVRVEVKRGQAESRRLGIPMAPGVRKDKRSGVWCDALTGDVLPPEEQRAYNDFQEALRKAREAHEKAKP